MGYGKAKKNYAMALKKKKSYAIRKVSQDVIGKKTRMKRSAWNYGKAKDLKGNVIGDDISSDKEIRINKPFKKNKNLYTRRVIKSRNIDGSPRKTTITKIGDKKRKTKIKSISERNLRRSFEKTKKRVERSRRGIVDTNYSIAVKSNSELWNRMKAKAKAKMGGKHSARAMQLATRMYQKAGGGYRGNKPK